jgi:hypothetical protein
MNKWLSAVRRTVELQAGRFIAGTGNFGYMHLTGFSESHWVPLRYVHLAVCRESHWIPFRYVHLAECSESHWVPFRYVHQAVYSEVHWVPVREKSEVRRLSKVKWLT